MTFDFTLHARRQRMLRVLTTCFPEVLTGPCEPDPITRIDGFEEDDQAKIVVDASITRVQIPGCFQVPHSVRPATEADLGHRQMILQVRVVRV